MVVSLWPAAGRSAIRLSGVAAVLVMLLALIGHRSVSGQGYDIEVGEPHFDFVLPRIDNREPVALRDFRGKKVLLIQFASW